MPRNDGGRRRVDPGSQAGATIEGRVTEKWPRVIVPNEMTLPGLKKHLTKSAPIYYHKYMRMRINRNYAANGMQGHPQTKQRRLLLDLIQETGGHIDAKELIRLAVNRDSSISPATVYRTLNLFKQLGLIDEKRLGKSRCYYETSQSFQHQHLVCSRCGKVIDFECPLSELVEKVKREHGFTVTKAEVYLEGCCSSCGREREEGSHAR